MPLVVAVMDDAGAVYADGFSMCIFFFLCQRLFEVVQEVQRSKLSMPTNDALVTRELYVREYMLPF
jgi:hypothetical protein